MQKLQRNVLKHQSILYTLRKNSKARSGATRPEPEKTRNHTFGQTRAISVFLGSVLPVYKIDNKPYKLLTWLGLARSRKNTETHLQANTCDFSVFGFCLAGLQINNKPYKLLTRPGQNQNKNKKSHFRANTCDFCVFGFCLASLQINNKP